MYPAIRDLLMAAEQEKLPINDGVEVALAAKVGISLPVTEIRLLSNAQAGTCRMWSRLSSSKSLPSSPTEAVLATPTRLKKVKGQQWQRRA